MTTQTMKINRERNFLSPLMSVLLGLIVAFGSMPVMAGGEKSEGSQKEVREWARKHSPQNLSRDGFLVFSGDADGDGYRLLVWDLGVHLYANKDGSFERVESIDGMLTESRIGTLYEMVLTVQLESRLDGSRWDWAGETDQTQGVQPWGTGGNTPKVSPDQESAPHLEVGMSNGLLDLIDRLVDKVLSSGTDNLLDVLMGSVEGGAGEQGGRDPVKRTGPYSGGPRWKFDCSSYKGP